MEEGERDENDEDGGAGGEIHHVDATRIPTPSSSRGAFDDNRSGLLPLNLVKEEEREAEVAAAAESSSPERPPPPPNDDVEQTIWRMEEAQVCLHPTHCHSFRQVHFPLFRKCIVCQERLPLFGGAGSAGGTLGGGGSALLADSGGAVVRCVACGAVAHRSCTQQSSSAELEGHPQLPVCPVNRARLDALLAQGSTACDIDDSFDDGGDDENEADNAGDEKGSAPPVASDLRVHHPPVPPIPTIALPEGRDTASVGQCGSGNIDDFSSGANADASDTNAAQDDEEVHVSPLHYAHHPFASISRALQENVLAAHLRWRSSDVPEEQHSEAVGGDSEGGVPTSLGDPAEPSKTAAVSTSAPHEAVGVVLPTTPPDPAPPRLVRLVGHTLDLVKATVGQASSTVRSAAPTAAAAAAAAASVAVAGGALAGGMAGLVLAGPAGCYVGSLGGASALGVILEGGVSVGIFVGGVAAGGYVAQQAAHASEQQRRRVLALGEEGAARKVLLVRPLLRTDPVWESIAREARRSAPGDGPSTSSSSFSASLGAAVAPLLGRFKDGDDDAEAAVLVRYRREVDIVSAEEGEISTKDKVLLLVGRALSDKSSTPGYVYRYLVDAFLTRCKERRRQQTSSPEEDCRSPATRDYDMDDDDDDDTINNNNTRVRRDDVHAVIRYVTEALLEFRPALGGTPTFTEWTATAVESLVFGRLYDPVYEEIVAETSDADALLQSKIRAFEEAWASRPNLVSEGALEALHTLPQAHSAADKLHYCVRFLELLSEFYLDSRQNDGPGASSHLCADSLLKLTCQHIIAARLPHANAEVAFLEEFARDEQLLRGREGYSLVTLQAALHFLNRSEDLERDIFNQDDQEENLPVAPPTTENRATAHTQEQPPVFS